MAAVYQHEPQAAMLPAAEATQPDGADALPRMRAPQAEPVDALSVAQAIARARRIVVLCGAGISCAAGIPDFRSSEGLFKTLKEKNPRAGLTSGKDLFSASLFQNEASTALFYQMITDLRTTADHAEPTAFHRLLKILDEQGKLLRVYTQNIDGLEEKAGLSYGLDAVGKPAETAPVKRKRPAPKFSRAASPTSSLSSLSPSDNEDATPSHSSKENVQLTEPTLSPSKKRSAPVTAAACRVIPLHGSMQTGSCTKCHFRMTLDLPCLELLSSGKPMACPRCSEIDRSRKAVSERSRGIGLIRVDVVLYGEEHVDALRIGEITQRDLMGPRPDLLLVVGTSIKVPGTKRLVRELAKIARPADTRDGEIRSVYMNLWEPGSEFKGVFDTWLQADVQEVAVVVADEVRKRSNEVARKRALQGKAPLGFPVIKPRPLKGEPKPKVAKMTPKPQQPKRKPGLDVVEMVDRNVFREVHTDLGPRRAKLAHTMVSVPIVRSPTVVYAPQLPVVTPAISPALPSATPLPLLPSTLQVLTASDASQPAKPFTPPPALPVEHMTAPPPEVQPRVAHPTFAPTKGTIGSFFGPVKKAQESAKPC